MNKHIKLFLKKIVVLFLAPPKISSAIGMRDQKLHAGQTLKLFVEFSGHPSPTAHWFCNDHEVKPKDGVTIDAKGQVASITVHSVSKKEKGRWQVQLRNDGGMADAKCNITVFGKSVTFVPVMNNFVQPRKIEQALPILDIGVFFETRLTGDWSSSKTWLKLWMKYWGRNKVSLIFRLTDRFVEL